MKDYIYANMAAYESTAEEFQDKKKVRLTADSRIAKEFRSYLKAGDHVLELGTGSGQLSRLLCELGLSVSAIEYAPKMAALAAQTAPEAEVIVDEFMGHDFAGGQYDGIIGIAFIHLFNADDARSAMAKINDLLVPGGILMLATTVHEKTFDDIVRKTNFKTEVSRFRRHYTVEDFKGLFINSGFTVKTTTIDDDKEVNGKKWVNVVGVKALRRHK